MEDKLKFNWYENPDKCLVLLDEKASQNLVEVIKQKHGFNKNISKVLELDISFIYQLRKNKAIRIKTLKKILDKLEIKYNIFNKNICGIGGSKYVFNVRFPIKLDKIYSSILIAAFMSDGHNNKTHPHYANVGFLGDKIIKSANSLVYNIPYEFRNEHVRFHPVLGRVLLKLGVPYGCKSYINLDVPKEIFSNKEWMKEYLIQAFDDEGHAATRKSRKIVFGRSVTLRDFPEEFSKNMDFSKKRMFNSLPNNIKEIALGSPPKLLVSEQKMLDDFGIKSSLRCRGICKYMTRVSADWVIEISGKENLKLFNDKIGFSEPGKIKKMEIYLSKYYKS